MKDLGTIEFEDGLDELDLIKAEGEAFIHEGKKYYVGWMKSKMPGEDDFCMWINEQPHGGFAWEFLDFRPSDEKNYCKIYILANDPRIAPK